MPVETWVRLKLSYQWDYYLDFSLVYAENDVPIYTITDFIVDNNADTWDVPKSSGSPCFGISPEGNMEFRLIISEPYFALSKIHIHSGMKYFTFVTTTHLDEEFNDDNFESWDTFDLNGFNYTCLLYTSPSPRDLSTSRMPSSA